MQLKRGIGITGTKTLTGKELKKEKEKPLHYMDI